MLIDKIKEKIRIAEEATRDLNGDLKVKGFEVILNHLLSEDSEKSIEEILPRETERKKEIPEGDEGDFKKLLPRLNIERYGYVKRLKGTAQYLSVIDIFNKEFHIDHLSANEISIVLSNKFGIKKRPNAITNRLGTYQAKYVDRTQFGKTYRYSLLTEGLTYLRSKITEEE